MITRSQTLRVARDAPTCYRYLVDFSTCEQWNPAVYRAAKRTPGAPGLGSKFDVSLRGFPRVELRYRIEWLKTGIGIELSATGDGLRGHERIYLRMIDAGRTEIDYHAEFEFTGLLRAAQTPLKPMIARLVRTAAAGLKRALEIDYRPPRQGWISYAADRSVALATPAFTDRGYFALEDKSHSEYLDGQVVVVTGASRGIGRAAAAEYARLGAGVVLLGRDRGALADAAAYVRDFAGRKANGVDTCTADLLSIEQTRAAAARLAGQYPRIDVLINNAGAAFATHALTADGLERSIAVNLVAPFVLTEALLEPLTAAGARVINMASAALYLAPLALDDMNSVHGRFDGTQAYAHAKRALLALSQHWARRYGDTGMRFNAMHPGWVATGGAARARIARALPGFDQALGPVLRHPRMGADTAVWLGAARAAAGFNGQFFFDRTPRPTAVVPNTRVLPSQAQRLYGWLRNTTGGAAHGVG